MNDDSVVQLLTEIRDGQKVQLAHQEEMLQMQRVQFAAFKKNLDRAEQIQERAEKLQERSAQVIGFARKLVLFVIPPLILLLLFLMFGRSFR